MIILILNVRQAEQGYPTEGDGHNLGGSAGLNFTRLGFSITPNRFILFMNSCTGFDKDLHNTAPNQPCVA